MTATLEQQLQAYPKNSAAVNKVFAQLGITEHIVRNPAGYVYFYGGNAASWPSTSVMVYRVSDCSVFEWLTQWCMLRTADANFQVVTTRNGDYEVIGKTTKNYNYVLETFKADAQGILALVQYVQTNL